MTEQPRAFSEQIETTGAQLVEQVKRLIAEGNARVLRIKEPDGHVMLEIKLTVGALAGGAVALAAPWLAVIGAIAALATHVTIEIVGDTPDVGAGNDAERPTSGGDADSHRTNAA